MLIILLSFNSSNLFYMNDTTKILAAFAAGALVGAAVGILFAPDKGSETRRKIGEEGKKIADSMKNKIAAGKEKFDNLKEGIRRTVKEETQEFA
jgi:gas vesicle protein